jgi:hypothetical protein
MQFLHKYESESMKSIVWKMFSSYKAEFRKNWKEAWSRPDFRIMLLLTSIALLATAWFIPDFFNFIQSRPGRHVNDLLLKHIPAHDVSLFIFSLLYTLLLLTLLNLSHHPALLLKCLQAYCFLLILRICTLFLFPLEPEQSLVPLQDPFIGRFFYSNAVITKDLFFSGHVSTLFLIFLVNPLRQLNLLFLVSTFILAGLILIQHVHYTADVLAAPVFAWISYTLAGFFSRKPK